MANDFDLDLEIQGLEQLQARLGDPELVRQALRVFASRAATTGKRTAVKAIEGGAGIATRSIAAKVDVPAGEIFVKTMMPRWRAISIEEGRTAGNPPNLGSIINWKEAVGHPDSGREIQRQIAVRGVKGKAFLGQVVERWRDNLPRWLEEAARRIEKKFKTGSSA